MLDKQLHDMIMQIGNNSNSVSKQNPMVTEITEGLIVSRPAMKEEEPVIIDLQEYARSGSKAASYATVAPNGINKVREIAEFIFSNGRIV